LVIVVDIDEASLEQFGQWPWPRTIVAQLLSRIFEAGGVVVGLDILFAEPDRLSPPSLAEADYLGGLDEDAKAYLRSLPENDDILADVIRQTRVVVGRGVTNSVSRNDPAVTDNQAESRYRGSFAKLGGSPDGSVPAYRRLISNLPQFEQASAGQGVFTLDQESDGIVRRIPALYRVDDDLLPALSLEILRVATGETTIVVSANEAGIDSVILGRLRIPTDGAGRIWLYSAPRDPNRFISAADVLQRKIDAEAIKGKVVLIGTSAVGLRDFRSTPVNGSVPGVEVHAQLIDSILAESFLVRSNFALSVELLITAIAALLVILLTPRLGALKTMAFGSILAISIVGTSWYYFSDKLELLDITYPLFGSFVIYGAIVFNNYMREEKAKQFVRSAFSQYLAPAVVEQLSERPEQLRLGGDTRDMTILFSDVRGFTALSEKHKDDPNVITDLISSLLTPLTEVILDEQGTIDKFMGDCVMAFWNAPVRLDDHPYKACKAALRMLDALDQFNHERALSVPTWEPLRLGIGINTGTCVVGNMGTPKRFDYTVMGDAVNLASRLEGLSSAYGVKAIVGEETARRIAHDFALLELDRIAVKGKQQAGKIYGLLGDADVLHDENFKILESAQQAMLADYRDRNWDKALHTLAHLRSLKWTAEGFCALFEDRIQAFMATPPPANWDGVYVAEVK
jgi:adenylate cyclase